MILGEGKCGKTHEFKLQHKRLRSQGHFSFFVPLELLQDSEFSEVITEDEEKELHLWISNSDAEAVFFLDAVDELKLRKGTLRKALRKIKDAVKSQTHRARFFISCRPNDWNDELDAQTLSDLLPDKKQTFEVTENINGEELFTAVISRNDFFGEAQKAKREKKSDSDVQVLALLPLTQDEIAEFARRYAPEQAESFEEHLNQKELWYLYQLPTDIISALDQLTAEGQLGNLQEQLVFGIGQRLREVSVNKRHTLSEAKAMEGAERIALALFLMKRRSIYLEAPGKDREGVSIPDILTDWSRNEQIELLGKPLFDPTGVGAVRFHHRSTQEFLAAQRLKKLRATGLATNDIHHLLFRNIADERVVIPSMEPIAAWLALWFTDILSEVKQRNPLLLFRQGLPSLLSIELRAEILRIFVEKFSGNKWRQMGVGHQELKRVAAPELATLVRELWGLAYSGHDTRELFLELIYLTPMADCVDLAFQAAFDSELVHHHRIYAVWAILKCGTNQQIQDTGADILSGGWPERVVRSVLPDLFPKAIGLHDFLKLARSLTEMPRSVHGVGYALMESLKSKTITSGQKAIIRDHFSSAVWKNRTDDSRTYRAHSSYDHFVDAIIVACHETVPHTNEGSQSWAWSLAIAFHFGEGQNSIISKDEIEIIKEKLSENPMLREAFLGACFEIARALENPEDDWRHFLTMNHGFSLQPFTETDLQWLLLALSPSAIAKRRGVAFYALSSFIHNGKNPELAREVSNLISDRPDLMEDLNRFLNPPTREPDELDLEHQRWKKQNEKQEAKRVDGWRKWRQEVLADKESLLGEADWENTLYNLYNAIQRTNDGGGTWAHWNSDFVATAFSPAFLDQVRKLLSKFWRRENILLFSERTKDSRNSLPAFSLMALAALKCEAEIPGWAETLTHEDAVRATRISTLELNGFGAFLSQIEMAHPDAIKEVIGIEVQAQVGALSAFGSAPLLHDVLYHGTSYMQKITASAIASNLPALEAAMPSSSRSDLEYAVELIASHGTDSSTSQFVLAIQNQLYTSNQLTNDDWQFWIKMLAQIDLERACENILEATNNLASKEVIDFAISLFANIFGDRHTRSHANFDNLEENHRQDLLQKLVIRTYQIVPPGDDLYHEGVYTPSVRDRAEDAREYLLQNLVSIKSPRTLSILREFSAAPELAHLTDRLKQMATELAAQMSEPNSMSALCFQKFDQEKNYFPYDTSSLFAVMNHRLSDFEHHLLNDEQTTIDTFRRAETEIELRRFISYWLNQNSRGAYTITQESVVVAEKRTDIRLHASGLDRYASIEVKLDNGNRRWSGTQLREALVDQLVGRYLNHERCRVGCLLVCISGFRRWEHPETGERMNLKEIIDWLQSIANEIMMERPELLISVKGIDYSVTSND